MSFTIEIVDGEEYRVQKLPGGAVVRELNRSNSSNSIRQMSHYEFMQLIGDQNSIDILAAAKTDPFVELMMEKLRQSKVIDFDDETRGPVPGLQYLLSQGILTQSEYDRILRLEIAV